MSIELLKTVKRLNSQLRAYPEPQKLLKTFRRLAELPITLDLLVETGVGKTVNSFRRREAVGDVARSLVAKWRKLIPQPADRSNSHTKEASYKDAQSRGDGQERKSTSQDSRKDNGLKRVREEEDSFSDSSAALTSPEKRRRVVEGLPIAPEIPLPAIQPNGRPLPSTSVTPQRCKVPAQDKEESTGYMGMRCTTKTAIYSGRKTSNLPSVMSPREKWLHVLQNNIDSIAEVPSDILKPVLERCSPEQLRRIEQKNPSFLEDLDKLWMSHCKRDFRHETPLESESWTELYRRLHDEREERLKRLTSRITSAHANKHKGRLVKMIDVKPANIWLH